MKSADIILVSTHKRGNACHNSLEGVMGNAQNVKAGECRCWSTTTAWRFPAEAFRVNGEMRKQWVRHYKAFKAGLEDASWLESRGLRWA